MSGKFRWFNFYNHFFFYCGRGRRRRSRWWSSLWFWLSGGTHRSLNQWWVIKVLIWSMLISPRHNYTCRQHSASPTHWILTKKNKNYPLLWNEVLCFDEMNILKKILFENAKLKSLVGMMVSRNETSSATKFSKFWVDVIILSFLLNSISVSFDWRTQESWTKMAGMLFFFLLLKHEGRKRGKSLSKYQEKYGRILCFLAFCLLFFLE